VSLWVLLLCAFLSAPARGQGSSKPKVRAITGFVRLERAQLAQQVGDALTVLRGAKREFEKQGYVVESLRIVTQPLGELVDGLSDPDALGFLQRFDALSTKESFLPGVGPAMLKDSDDPRPMRLLARALSTLPNIEGNAVLAGEDGIHWKVIRDSAALLREVTDHSPGSIGSFNFTGTAMLQ
jgi:hypothetical protein